MKRLTLFLLLLATTANAYNPSLWSSRADTTINRTNTVWKWAAGNDTLIITRVGNAWSISGANYPSVVDTAINIRGGTGEANTIGDAGVPDDVTAWGLIPDVTSKTGVKVLVRSLLEGANISITNSGDTALAIASAQTAGLDSAEVMDIVQDSISGDVTLNASSVATVGDDSHAHTTTTVSGLVDGDVANAITVDPVNATTEAAIEAVVDLEDLQGAVTDAQIPDIFIRNTGDSVAGGSYFWDWGENGMRWANGDLVIGDTTFGSIVLGNGLFQIGASRFLSASNNTWVFTDHLSTLDSFSFWFGGGLTGVYPRLMLDTAWINDSVRVDSALHADKSDDLVDTSGTILQTLKDRLDTSLIGHEVDTNTTSLLDGYVLTYNLAGTKWEPAAQGASGEANTLSDTGTFNGTSGFGLAGGKTGTALKVKGLIEGSNVTIAASADSAYTITSANETMVLSGDVTGSGATAITTVIGADKIDSLNVIDLSLQLGDLAASGAVDNWRPIGWDSVNGKWAPTDTIGAAGRTTMDSAHILGRLVIGNSADSFWFPVVDGSANQILKTDGNGVLSWAADDSADYLGLDTARVLLSDRADTTTGSLDLQAGLEWSGGNIVYVPIDSSIQDAIDNASAGTTLLLAGGNYVLTTGLTVNKQINIVGQGSAGFTTAPVTPSQGTLISSSTANLTAFDITASNVRLSNFSIDMTGSRSAGVKVANNLDAIVIRSMDVVINCADSAIAFSVLGSNTIMRDVSFYVTSTDNKAAGVYFYNNSSTTQNATLDCFTVTGTAQGAATYAYAFVCHNNNDADTVNLNLHNSVCKVLPGTPSDYAVMCWGTITSNAITNAYMCTFDADDFDAWCGAGNVLSLGGSVMENNLINGNVTYRASMIAGGIQTDTLFADSIRCDTLIVDQWVLADSAQFDGNVDVDSMDINGVLDVTGTLTAANLVADSINADTVVVNNLLIAQDATDAIKGLAKFDTESFTVTAGNVALDPIASGDILNGTIEPVDLNQSSKFNFNSGIYATDSTVADSAYVTKQTSEAYANSILTGALIENPRIIGHLELTENIYQWNRTTEWDTSNVWANNADTFLRWSLPTGAVSAGLEDSSYGVHPDIQRIPLGWNGWIYLMGFTPMFSDDALTDEDPMLMASNNGDYFVPFIAIDSVTYDSTAAFWDGGAIVGNDTADCTGACDSVHYFPTDTWAYQPRGDYDSSKLAIIWGDTVPCPITDETTLTDTLRYPGGDTTYVIDHLSDPDIRLFTNDTLYYFFRASYKDSISSAGNMAHAIWVMATADGITWVDTTRLFVARFGGGTQLGTMLLSPTVFVDTGGIMTMYIVTDTNTTGAPCCWGSTYGGPLIVERRQSTHPTDTAQWQANVDTCDWTSPWNEGGSLGTPPGFVAGRNISVWHIECQRVGDEVHCFEVMVEHGSAGDKAHTFFTKSRDGLYFRSPEKPFQIPRATGHWDDDRVYRGSGVVVNFGNSLGYEYFYSALGLRSAVNRWSIGRTYIHFEPRWKYMEFDQVYNADRASDTTILSFEQWDSTTNQFYWFSDSADNANDSGRVGMSGVVSDFPFNSDTLVYWYKTTGEIDSIEIFVARDTNNVIYNYESYTVFPDSLAYNDPTNRTSTSLARVALGFDFDFSAGERVGILFHNVMDDDADYVRVYNAHLKGTEIGKNQ